MTPAKGDFRSSQCYCLVVSVPGDGVISFSPRDPHNCSQFRGYYLKLVCPGLEHLSRHHPQARFRVRLRIPDRPSAWNPEQRPRPYWALNANKVWAPYLELSGLYSAYRLRDCVECLTLFADPTFCDSENIRLQRDPLRLAVPPESRIVPTRCFVSQEIIDFRCFPLHSRHEV
jgi:hypothetical protein